MKFAQYLHPQYGEIQVPINKFPNKFTGVLEGKRPTDWFAGKVGSMPYEIKLPSADWRPFSVLGEKQWFENFDSFNCTGYANNNSSEIQLKQQTGYEFNWSDEAMSVLAECTKEGNYVYKPADVGKDIGRIRQEDWTVLNPQTWEQYNQKLPSEVLKKVVRFYERYEWIDTSRASLEYHLKQAPILIIIKAGDFFHNVVLLHINNQGLWYFDSYQDTDGDYIKLTTQYPTSALKLIVKPQSNSKFVKRTGTDEYGFYLPALSIDSLKDKALNFGMNQIIKSDGSIDFSQAKEMSGL